MLRILANELSELLSNLGFDLNILIFTLFYIIFSITRIKRLNSSENLFNPYEEVTKAIRDISLVPVLTQIIFKFIFISEFRNYLDGQEIILIISLLLVTNIVTINQGLDRDISYLSKEIIKLLQKQQFEENHYDRNVTNNNQLSSSQNPDISNNLRTGNREDIVEEEPPQ